MKPIVLWQSPKNPNVKIEVKPETISRLLTIDPNNYIADKELEDLPVVLAPTTVADQRSRLKRFGYTDAELDIIEEAML